MKAVLIYPILVGVFLANSAMAASPAYMMEHCKNSTQIFFNDFQARTEPKYEGQRTDRTHVVNGTIFLKAGAQDVQCSYNAKGDTLVGFFAEGKSWPGFVRGEGSPHMAAKSGAPAAAPAAATAAAGSDKKFTYRCTLKVKNEPAPRDMGCDFSQRQGFVRIFLEDGAEYALEPTGSTPGNFRDTTRNVPVYRRSVAGNKGVTFDFPTETIRVHW